MAQPDFVFHWENGGAEWTHLRVVAFRGVERVSTLFEYRLTLHARSDADAVDPEELVGCLATLRLATLSVPAVRTVHGLIAEAEEIGSSDHGVLYEVLLVPPLVRAAHRTRSRIFLEKTTREVVEAVLTGDPRMTPGSSPSEPAGSVTDAFQVPKEEFAWRVVDPSRIDDPKVRPYCVQYNESDFAFVARLLEEEGIAFHYEHGAEGCLLVLSDDDDGKSRLEPFDALGPAEPGRELGAVRLGGRLRPGKVTLHDYNWKKPKLDMKSEAAGESDDLFVTSYPGRYPDAPDQGTPLAKVLLERLGTEARTAAMEGGARVLFAGSVFDLHHETARYEGEYLVTALELHGEQAGELPPGAAGVSLRNVPFRAKVECARRGKGGSAESSKFRPARRTPKPKITGSQTAVVTDEPSTRGAEIHVGGPEGVEIGCVRLKFHWDAESERHDKEPTSCWVRVSQAFAGAGEGAVFHPRVGVEVIVEFLDGDPDRPIVVGRVYNGVNRPPAPSKGADVISTMKSMSSPGGGTCNSFTFDDSAGKEQVNLFAGKDWNNECGNNRTEKVGNDSSSDVAANRSETTGANRTTSVSANNDETVSGAETVSVTGNQTITVSASQSTSVSADRSVAVGATQTVSVGSTESYSVGASQTVAVGAARTTSVAAAESLTVGAARTTSIGASDDLTVGGSFAALVSGTLGQKSGGDMSLITAANFVASAGADLGAEAGGNASLKAGGTVLVDGGGAVAIQAPSISVTGSTIVLSAGGGSIEIGGGGVTINGGSVKVAGGSVDITGGVVNVN